MIDLTDIAAGQIMHIRSDEEIPEEQGLRIGIRGGGCAGFNYNLYFDDKKEMDQEFDIKGIKIFVDQMSAMYVAGTEIDYVTNLMGSGFKFNNPNVKSTCGCGLSFQV